MASRNCRPTSRPRRGQLRDGMAERRLFASALIDGVTGSGKTEVYFEAVAEALKHGRQVLILLPEIALTASFLERFQDRFGAKPAEWHSDLGAENARAGVAPGCRRARCGSWPARARRCSCRSPIWA